MFYYILPASLPSADNQNLLVRKLQLESDYLMFQGTLFIFIVVVIVELMLVPGKGLSATLALLLYFVLRHNILGFLLEWIKALYKGKFELYDLII